MMPRYSITNLVGGFNLPLWKMMDLKSVGMMTFPIWWDSHKIPWFQSTNQKWHLTCRKLLNSTGESWYVYGQVKTSLAPWLAWAANAPHIKLRGDHCTPWNSKGPFDHQHFSASWGNQGFWATPAARTSLYLRLSQTRERHCIPWF
jgi:hypothetical protein